MPLTSTSIRASTSAGLRSASVGQVDTQLRAARAYFVDAIGEVWSTVNAGDECSFQQRAGVMGAAQLLLRSAVTAADALVPFAGATAIADDEPLQRCLRDLQAARQHIFFAPDALKRVGRVALGLDPEHWMF